jgi:plasmid stabilization system protein ParE
VIYRVILQPRAERDLQEAAHWIREQSKSSAIALRWVLGIRSKIASLKSNPQRCPIDPDSTAYGEVVRVMLHGKRHGKYRVLFTVRGDIVHVLTVRHSARQSLADEGDDNAEEQPDSRH